MTELDEPFIGVDGAFKLHVDKLISIHGLLTWKTTEYVGFNVVHSY